MTKPYTYLLKWSNTNMKYYGARWGQNCHPYDLFSTYFTSSTYVKNYINENGFPDIIQIRRTFKNCKDVQLWENKVLKRLGAPSRSDYINKNYGSKGWDPSDLEIRRKISESKTGIPLSKETKRKISESSSKIKHTAEWNYKVSLALKGKTHSEQRKKNIRNGRANGPIRKCPYCSLEGKGPNMSRYHFDNCKSKK